jgi:hypothetical protein
MLLLVHKSLIGIIEFVPASLIFLLIVLLAIIIGVWMLFMDLLKMFCAVSPHLVVVLVHPAAFLETLWGLHSWGLSRIKCIIQPVSILCRYVQVLIPHPLSSLLLHQ